MNRLCSIILTVIMLFAFSSAVFAADSLRVDKEELNEGLVHGDFPEFLYAPLGGKQDDQLNIMVCRNYARMLYPLLDSSMTEAKINQDINDLFSDLDKDNPVASAEKLLLATANYLHQNITSQRGLKTKQAQKTAGCEVLMSFNVYANDGKYLSFEQMVDYTHDGEVNSQVMATNIDLKTNKHLVLKDIFKPGSDYAPRLQEYITKQQGRIADISRSFGDKVFNYNPVVVTGEEQFCFDNRISTGNELTIIFDQGKVGNQVVRYNVPMDVLKDIVNEPFLKRAK